VFKTIALLLIISFIFIGGLGLLALQSTPQFTNNKTVNVLAATQSKKAAKRFITSLKTKKQPVILSLSQTEINGLNALLNRAFPQIVSDVIIDNTNAKINLSVELPLPKLIKYLNISGDLYPSNKGLELGDIDIGSLTISGNTLVSFSRWFIDTFVQDEMGTELVSMVQWVTLNNSYLKSSLLIPKDMSPLKQGKSGLLVLRDNLALFGDVNRVKVYYQALVTHLDELNNSAVKNRQLSYYIQFIFTLARNTVNEESSQVALKENHAALMALALYFGSDSFEVLVGDVSNLSLAQKSTRNFLRNKVMLRNRVDLQKHFMYSVALQLFGNNSASDAIGELKELLDSNPGGSGFSFADLMADRAGTRLAKLATISNTSASRLQKLLSGNIQESDFMPDIQGMPEGISSDVFNADYKDVNSKEYKQMLSVLDERLAELTLYN